MTIAPRRAKTYAARAIYGLILIVLISTAWLILTGTQLIRDVGDFARFGTTLFQIIAPLQLALAVFFSAVLTAGAVAQEKDRKTLLLLLLTNLSNSELVLGKLLSSLLYVLMLTVVSLPIFALCVLFGGVSFVQLARVYIITIISVLAAGSLGSVIALWREKTFQAIAMTVLILVLWVAVWEIVGLGIFGETVAGVPSRSIAIALSPWSAVREATIPQIVGGTGLIGLLQATFQNILPFVILGSGITFLINLYAVVMVRVWNPSREMRPLSREEEAHAKESIWGAEYDLKHEAQKKAALADLSEHGAKREAAAVGEVAADGDKAAVDPNAGRYAPAHISAEAQPTRAVWNNPILWREIRTRAYGRKTLIIRLFYWTLFALSALGCYTVVSVPGAIEAWTIGAALVPLMFISLVLVNAQAVTSLTSERDGKTLDILLVSDLTPKEFVYGKLGGVFYNAKDMILLPLLLCVYVWWERGITSMNLFYLITTLLVLYGFVAMVGVHTGMNYPNSRTAISTSLGTVFFLFAGIASCMWMMIAFSGSFQAQLQPFLAFMIGGGIGLYFGLGARNPSKAIGAASFLLPLATFYAVTSMLLGQPHLVFVSMCGIYGFTIVAMLIPAIDEFDVATGRTTAD